MTPRYPKYIKSAEVTAINSWTVSARTTELMHVDYNWFEKAGKSIKKQSTITVLWEGMV